MLKRWRVLFNCCRHCLQERDTTLSSDRHLSTKTRFSRPSKNGRIDQRLLAIWDQITCLSVLMKNFTKQPRLLMQSPYRGDRAPCHISIYGDFAFKLYDTYGFPLDLTELMARERGLTVDVAGFEKLMDEQRERARKAQKKEEISVEEGELGVEPTKFLGYDFLETEAVVETVLPGKKKDEVNVVLDRTPFYAEMGGQVGDRGLLHVPGHDWTEVGQLRVIDTQKRGDVFVHRATVVEGRAPEPGEAVRVSVDADRRKLIQGHHTVTHLLHWALHEVVSRDASQKGSYVGPDKLTFDFSSAPLTPEQEARRGKIGERKNRGECAGFMD